MNLASLNECLEGDSPFCKLDNLIPDNNNYNSNNNEIVGGGFEESKMDEIYKSFLEFFGDILMSKYKLMNEYCAYIGKIKCHLAFGTRAIVVILPDDNLPIGTMKPLHTLYWINLQTRFIKKELSLRDNIIPEKKNNLMNSIVERYDKQTYKSEYKVHGYNELKVTLFRKKESIQDWSDKNKLYVALNTYSCSVDFI